MSAEKKSEAYVLCCSGYANVGKATHQVAVELARNGVATLTCLAQVSAGVEKAIQRVEQGKIIALDGCDNKCALITLQKCGYEPHVWVNAENCGMKKTGAKDDPTPENIKAMYQKVIEVSQEKI